MDITLTTWPEWPALPKHGEAVVIRIRETASRHELSRIARRRALAIVRAWGYADASMEETPHGPVLLGCDELRLSLSYTVHTAWIAFCLGRPVGVDATPIAPFPGLGEVARLFLGPEAEDVLGSEDPSTAFAFAWSRHEAALKCQRLPLCEWRPTARTAPHCASMRTEDVAVSVALGTR